MMVKSALLKPGIGQILLIVTVVFLAGCIGKKKEENLNSKITKEPKRDIDSSMVGYEFDLVNDKAFLNINKISAEDETHVIIDMTYQNQNLLTKKIYKEDILSLDTSPFFLDTLNHDFTYKARIKTVDFKFVRGSTLYFDCVMENQEENKKISGRFNLFFKTNRKGEVYGWITDSVEPFK